MKALLNDIERIVKKINANLERLENTLTDHDIHELHVDKATLTGDMENLAKMVNNLNFLIDSPEKLKLVETLSIRTDKVVRSIEIIVRKSEATLLAKRAESKVKTCTDDDSRSSLL